MKVGFIGAGKVGRALGLYLKNHGLTVSGYHSKTGTSAQEAARMTGSKHFTSMQDIANSSSVLMVAVPDHALAEVDHAMATLMKAQNVGSDKYIFHLSGAHSSDALAGIKAAGAEVGSMHPLQSFGEPISSAKRLISTWFTLEGTGKAVELAQDILSKTGNQYSLIKSEDKALYHAGACVVSNFLVTLVECGIQFFEQAGMELSHIVQAIDPLMESTLSNIREKGTVGALTGPIIRGDCNTLSVHLDAMQARLPEELDVYQSMARRTIQMLEDKSWNREEADRFRLLLGETIYVN